MLRLWRVPVDGSTAIPAAPDFCQPPGILPSTVGRCCASPRAWHTTQGRQWAGVTICRMKTLTIRTDAHVERALEALTSEGQSRSEAVRQAILQAERTQRRALLRAEAESLRDDPEDAAASRELAAEMDAIRAR